MTDDSRIQVQVVYREPLLHGGLRAALQQHSDICVLDAAFGSDDLADVIVSDYESALKWFASRRHAPRDELPKVLIVTERGCEFEVLRAVRAGVRGYLSVSCSLDKLADGVRALHRGGRCMGELAMQRMSESLMHEALTYRELEVLGFLARGDSNRRIADALAVSVDTVKTHVKNIFSKLDASTRTEAAAVAASRGLLLVGVAHRDSESPGPRTTTTRHVAPEGGSRLSQCELRHDRCMSQTI